MNVVIINTFCLQWLCHKSLIFLKSQVFFGRIVAYFNFGMVSTILTMLEHYSSIPAHIKTNVFQLDGLLVFIHPMRSLLSRHWIVVHILALSFQSTPPSLHALLLLPPLTLPPFSPFLPPSLLPSPSSSILALPSYLTTIFVSLTSGWEYSHWSYGRSEWGWLCFVQQFFH